jgi:hypothetical protein
LFLYSNNRALQSQIQYRKSIKGYYDFYWENLSNDQMKPKVVTFREVNPKEVRLEIGDTCIYNTALRIDGVKKTPYRILVSANVIPSIATPKKLVLYISGMSSNATDISEDGITKKHEILLAESKWEYLPKSEASASGKSNGFAFYYWSHYDESDNSIVIIYIISKPGVRFNDIMKTPGVIPPGPIKFDPIKELSGVTQEYLKVRVPLEKVKPQTKNKGH